MPAIALIDIDSTLANYDEAICRDMAKIASPNDPPYVPHARNQEPFFEAREDLIRRQPGWWLNLDPIEANFKMVDFLQETGFCLHILTKDPASKPLAWKEKVEWVNKYVSNRYISSVQITVTQDKSLVYGRVLFDDFPPYCERWLKYRPRGLVIMPTHSGNKDFIHPNVVKYDGIITDEIREKVHHARWRM